MDSFEQFQATRKFSLLINGVPEEVFPLLCPVREKEWIPGWTFDWIYSNSGLIEECCVFITQEYDQDTYWFVPDYDPEKKKIVFVHFAPGLLISRFSVLLTEKEKGKTEIIVEYVFNALSKKEKKYIENELTQELLGKEMLGMKSLLNAHLG